MGPRYFEMDFDDTRSGARHLGDVLDRNGVEVSPWIFMHGTPVNVASPLKFLVYSPGRLVDFEFAGLGVPVGTLPVADLLSRFCGTSLQRVPALVDGDADKYAALNFLSKRRCVDEAASEFLKWTIHDHRSDKAGSYRQFTRLRIRPENVGDANVFRIEGWECQLIVSDLVKEAFESEGISGVRFEPVC